MHDERRIIAAVAVMLFAYALVALLAFSAAARPQVSIGGCGDVSSRAPVFAASESRPIRRSD